MTSNSTRPSLALRSTEQQLKSLICAALDGDTRARSIFFRRATALLRAFFARRMRDASADVEDLVQEALIAVHTRRLSYDRTRPITPWLYSVARHKLIDHFRRGSRAPAGELFEESLATDGFESESIAHLDVERLLHTLPAKQAYVIRQTKLKGMSIADVASGSAVSISDVKVSVHRGIKALARSISAPQLALASLPN